MKKRLVILIITIASAGFLISGFASLSSQSFIDKIRITEQDIPEGYRYGIIPDFAHDLLKENPWTLDQTAIKKLTHRIYPGAEYTNITSIHMTIIASNNNPYGDDIVCYIFTFKDPNSTKIEMAKLNEFVGYNSDRSIVMEKNNIAVYLLVDSVKDFEHIKAMSGDISKRLETL